MQPARRRILLINPNTNAETTALMVAIAQGEAGDRAEILGATATTGPRMILDPTALGAAAVEVVRMAASRGSAVDGLIVAAFGDPGLADIRRLCPVPAVGIAEAALLEAAAGGRRFGIATTTPNLAGAIDGRVAELGLGDSYTGIRLTRDDPLGLMSDVTALTAALAEAVRACIARDGAEAVVIGGGPLGEAAKRLQPGFAVPIVQPLPSAVRRLIAQLG